jgi:hypothetical protein
MNYYLIACGETEPKEIVLVKALTYEFAIEMIKTKCPTFKVFHNATME